MRWATDVDSVHVSSEQLGFLVELFGPIYPVVETPRSAWGSEHPWDASRFIASTIDALSSRLDSEAAKWLARLEANRSLEPYRDRIQHSQENRRRLVRQKAYVRPTWTDACNALRAGQPATPSDLHALTTDLLKTVIRDLRFGNTDTYRGFWNEDSRGKVVEPKNEESCRDRLIERLRALS